MIQAVDSNPTRTLRGVASEHADLVEWWNRFEVLCPDLASVARYIDVVEMPEAVKRMGFDDWVGEWAASGGADWVCFTGKPTLATFIEVLLRGALHLPYPLAAHLEFYFEQGVARRDNDLVEFGRHVVRAAIRWSPEDIQDRLGEQLWPGDRAKLKRAMTHPERLPYAVWAFLAQCIAGIEDGDPCFTRYAETLFGPIPEGAPAASTRASRATHRRRGPAGPGDGGSGGRVVGGRRGY